MSHERQLDVMRYRSPPAPDAGAVPEGAGLSGDRANPIFPQNISDYTHFLPVSEKTRTSPIKEGSTMLPVRVLWPRKRGKELSKRTSSSSVCNESSFDISPLLILRHFYQKCTQNTQKNVRKILKTQKCVEAPSSLSGYLSICTPSA